MTIRPLVPTLTNVASSATSVTLFAASLAAVRYLVNDSSAVLYLKFGTGAASTTSYTTQVAAGALFTFPAPVYNGAVTGIWASANGFARCTELA